MVGDPNDDDDKLKARDFHQGAPTDECLGPSILDEAALKKLFDEFELLRGDDPNDDPRSAWQKGFAAAYEQIAKLDSGELAELQHELIDKWVEVYRKELGGKVDEHIVPEIVKWFKYFKIGRSNTVVARTVYNAVSAMREKREAEEAHAKEVLDPPATKT
jgi:hypothetical protein